MSSLVGRIEQLRQDIMSDPPRFSVYRKTLEMVLVDCEELDDGVTLNMAPLRELFPSWKKEPEKFWKDLEEGKYDWSTVMRYWPERARAACKRSKSYAIAHGLEGEYEV